MSESEPDPTLPAWAADYLAAFDRHLANDPAGTKQMRDIAKREGLTGAFDQVVAEITGTQKTT